MSKVLVVDDNKQLCEDLKKHLEKKNYEVCTAYTVDEAKKKVLCEKFDYAIIDLKLEEVSWEFAGVEVIYYVKRNQPKVKTIILSGYSFEYVKEQLRQKLKEEKDSEKILKEIEQDYIFKGDKKNIIEAVLEKLDGFKQKKEKKNCFVIMPFSKTKVYKAYDWDEIFENVIKPAVEESGFNYQCERANIQFGNIFEEILDKLNSSELVIADITDKNPNVLYELGIRHTRGGPTIVIAQKVKDIPFDLTHNPYKIYGWKTQKEKDMLKKEIKAAIEYLEKNPQKAVSPILKYFNPPIREYLDPIGKKS
jgi:CheY-like chemotaxis protein